MSNQVSYFLLHEKVEALQVELAQANKEVASLQAKIRALEKPKGCSHLWRETGHGEKLCSYCGETAL